MISKKLIKTALTQDEIGNLFLIAAIILGAWFRFYPIIETDFPINDGGLFFAMIKAIQSHSYILPNYISYNGLDIPFIYPPFAFYVTGLIQDVSKVPLLDLFRWLPAIFATLTIPAVYLLALSTLDSNIQAGLAAFIYALLPRTVTWLIMGGGITRSLGQLFLILAIYSIYNLFRCNAKKYLFGAIIFSSLVCLTHPEAALHTFGIAILLFVYKIRRSTTWVHAGIIGIGTLLFTSPWWLTSLLRHGMDPFISASQTGLHQPYFLANFLVVPFSEEPFATTLTVLAMIGIVIQSMQKEYLLPLFFIIPAFVEPRSAATVSTIPMALLASITLCKLLFPGLANLLGRVDLQSHKILSTQPEKVLLGYLVIMLFLSMQYYGIKLSDHRVSEENLQAFKWIEANISPNSKFIMITGNAELFSDSAQEWFPVLSGRTNLTTIQGLEWISKNNFTEKYKKFRNVQNCSYDNNPFHCLEDQLDGFFPYNYVYITTQNPGMLNASTYSMPLNTIMLIVSLMQNKNYSLVYRTDSVAIFSRNEVNSTSLGDSNEK